MLLQRDGSSDGAHQRRLSVVVAGDEGITALLLVGVVGACVLCVWVLTPCGLNAKCERPMFRKRAESSASKNMCDMQKVAVNCSIESCIKLFADGRVGDRRPNVA